MCDNHFECWKNTLREFCQINCHPSFRCTLHSWGHSSRGQSLTALRQPVLQASTQVFAECGEGGWSIRMNKWEGLQKNENKYVTVVLFVWRCALFVVYWSARRTGSAGNQQMVILCHRREDRWVNEFSDSDLCNSSCWDRRTDRQRPRWGCFWQCLNRHWRPQSSYAASAAAVWMRR